MGGRGKGAEKKKSRIFMVRALWSDYWGIYWTPTVDFVIQPFIPIFVQRFVRSRLPPEITGWDKKYHKWHAWMAKIELWWNIYVFLLMVGQLTLSLTLVISVTLPPFVSLPISLIGHKTCRSWVPPIRSNSANQILSTSKAALHVRNIY